VCSSRAGCLTLCLASTSLRSLDKPAIRGSVHPMGKLAP
jgi:hypothetical protein